MRAVFLTKHFKDADEIKLPVEERLKPKIKPGECLVQIHSAGVNQSDAKAAIGFFAHAQLPRIPGRDFAGVVVEGSPQAMGKKVWGTGGAAGIDFDGTHAEFLALPEKAIAEIPKNLSLLQAGGQTLPYVTAYYGLLRARMQPGESVLVLGALGQVGRAAMSICRWKKCRPVALVKEESVEKARALGWEAVSAITQDFDIIYNPLGSLFWDEGLKHLKKFGRMVVIGVGGPNALKPVELSLLSLYRANQDLIGINTVDFDYTQNGKWLNELKSGFESGALVPLETKAVFPLEKAAEAYKAVLRHSKERVVLTFERG